MKELSFPPARTMVRPVVGASGHPGRGSTVASSVVAGCSVCAGDLSRVCCWSVSLCEPTFVIVHFLVSKSRFPPTLRV